LAAAEVAWGVTVLAPGVPLRNLRREGEVLYAGKRPVLRLKSEPEALDWFVGLGEAHDSDISGRTWQDLKASGFQVPRTRAEALFILQKVGTEKAKVEGLLESLYQQAVA
jgi:hypothetical protein